MRTWFDFEAYIQVCQSTDTIHRLSPQSLKFGTAYSLWVSQVSSIFELSVLQPRILSRSQPSWLVSSH